MIFTRFVLFNRDYSLFAKLICNPIAIFIIIVDNINMIYDFSKYELSNKEYGGSEKKIGIYIDGYEYMLKFQKKTAFGLRNNHISEYIGCKIYSMLGYSTQEVYLGIYKKENVVACKDFVIDGYQFVPFNDVGESSLEIDKEKYQYSYEDIVALLESNRKITNVKETIDIFFDMYIVDALLGNFDRHGGNWGFLKKANKYILSPIFDNGSCLYPAMVDENKMQQIINDEEEINKRIYSFPTSQIKLNGEKSSYYEVISSLQYKECNEALIRQYKKIDLTQIDKLIDSIEIISEIHKEFYKTMIHKRYEKIILESYKKLMEKKNG